ncbi:IMPACT family member YigZ [Corynebacterium atrinae]|nr:IMPACT family member YigZ [Corynebacterium atrinae]
MTSYELPAANRTWSDEYEVKRSRFIAVARRVSSEEQAREFIHEVKATYPDARHHCSAFIVAVDGAQPIERSSDDGEPSGTAGKPMLDMLKGSSLIDAAVVVVRYFGGVKLGAGGLVHAYSHAVGQLLPQVARVTRSLRELYTLDVGHSDAGRLEAELRGRGIEVVDVSYAARVMFTLAVAPGGREELASTLAALTSGAAQLRESGTAWVES